MDFHETIHLKAMTWLWQMINSVPMLFRRSFCHTKAEAAWKENARMEFSAWSGSEATKWKSINHEVLLRDRTEMKPKLKQLYTTWLET